jgi:ligand-binding sensor domain-containing protein
MPRSPHSRLWLIAGSALLAIFFVGAFTAWRASRVLHQYQVEVAAAQQIPVDIRPYAPQNSNFEVVSSPQVFIRAATFQNRLYIAGSSGLSEYDLGGTLLRQFSSGKELPSASLVALTVAAVGNSSQPALVLGTLNEGLLLFDGNHFQQIRPAEAGVRTITAILPAERGHLLIGTRKHGVLVFDGERIRSLHSTLDNLSVTALAGTETDLWVGTLDRGVVHWNAGTSQTFGESDGLPDRQVQAITTNGDKTYVGTPIGIAEFDRGRFSRVLGEGLFATALLAHGDELVVGTEDQGITRLPFSPHRSGLSASASTAQKLEEVRQIIDNGAELYILTRNAVLALPARGGLNTREVLKPRPATLSDSNVSALAEDKNGQLWVGYFDRGLDLLSAPSRPTVHIEDAHVFCVNRIWPDEKSGSVQVATANGLIRVGAAGNEQQILTRTDGLIADHVTDIAPYRDGLVAATPAGLTFLDSAGPRSMYAFQGLVNNHVYTLGVSGDDLLVGTLGGISVLDKETVRANFTAGASGLKQNWITAIVRVGDEWMIGTYGSGVMALDRAGHFRAFETATASIEINPNAMLVTPKYVLAGTLGHGLLIYNRDSGRWTNEHAGLPSENVTALAAGHGYLYIGTDNGLVRVQEEKLQP